MKFPFAGLGTLTLLVAVALAGCSGANEAATPGVGVFDSASAPLARGEGLDGYSLANISVDLEVKQTETVFERVTLLFADGSNEDFSIGRWSLRATETPDAIAPGEDWPVILPGCTTVDVALQNDSAEQLRSTKISAKQAGLRLDSDSVSMIRPEAHALNRLDFECDTESFDLFVTTPIASYATDQGDRIEQPLPPIMIGYMDYTDGWAERVKRR